MNLAKKLLASVAILGATFALTACNTVAGVGQDVKATGQGVTDAAKDVQKKM